jgi:hypothetical protein
MIGTNHDAAATARELPDLIHGEFSQIIAWTLSLTR